MNPQIRPASQADIPALAQLIERSVRQLQREDYTPAQIDGALRTVYGVDSVLVDDGTYLVVEVDSEIVACGGWSKRRTLYGGDVWKQREDDLLDPAVDAARIRAFFVDPKWSRRGLGTLLLSACENAARAAGFHRFEMGATLTGERFYERHGYISVEEVEVPLGDGEILQVVRMVKPAGE